MCVCRGRRAGRAARRAKPSFFRGGAGGCLDEAVSRCPRLSGEEKRIEAEHPQILARIDRLIAQLRSQPTAESNRLAMQKELHELSECLLGHEEAEDRLLQEAFGESVNGYEPGQCAAPVAGGDE